MPSSATGLSSPSCICRSAQCRHNALGGLPINRFGSRRLGNGISLQYVKLARPVLLPGAEVAEVRCQLLAVLQIWEEQIGV